jgi:hypothetical protein
VQAVIGNRLLASLKAAEKPYEVRDPKTPGFLLRVQPSGVMSYVCEYARGKRITIGRVGKVTPAQARDKAPVLRPVNLLLPESMHVLVISKRRNLIKLPHGS